MFLARPGRLIVRPILFGLVFFTLPSLPARAAPPSIVIGEVAWAGSSLSTADEWIELWNLGGETQSLSGWRLKGASGDHDIVLGNNASIPSRHSFLISNYSETDAKSSLNTIPDVVTTTISLPNDKLLIQLVDAAGAVIDQAGSGAAPPAGTSGSVRASMIRQTPVGDGSSAASWTTAAESKQLDQGATDRGTPGYCDGCVKIAVIEIPPTETIMDAPIEPPPEITLATSSSVIETPTVSSTPNNIPDPEPITISAESPVATTTEITLPTTSTTALVQSPAIQETAVALPVTTASPQTIRQAATMPPTIRINEIFPAPSTGPEWIELASDDAFQPSQLNGWTIEDAVGTIYRFDHSTQTFPDTPMHYLRIDLAGSHLNNSGDEVHLKTASGQLVHRIAYASAIKDQSWIRLPNETVVWRLTTTPTPDAANLLTIVTPTAPPPIVVQTEAPVIALVEAAENKIVDSPITTPTTTSLTTQPPQTEISVVAKRRKISSKKSVSASTAAVVKPKKVVKKTTKPKTTALIHPTSISMLSQMESGLRASLSGVVATVPGLLGNNQFVLQTEDGRGLLIYGNGKQLSPPFQSIVRLSGTLTTNDSGTSLHMYAQDRWSLLKEHATVMPRIIDLLAPSFEDVWSLVDVTATVREVKATHAILDADGVSLTLQIRPALHFRTQRLTPGDVIEVRGLLDTRAEEPRIIPRSPDEITIVKHAALAKSTGPSSQNSLPPWTPLGAAGVTVALAQGYKKIKAIREQRRLASLLKQASNEVIHANL